MVGLKHRCVITAFRTINYMSLYDCNIVVRRLMSMLYQLALHNVYANVFTIFGVLNSAQSHVEHQYWINITHLSLY